VPIVLALFAATLGLAMLLGLQLRRAAELARARTAFVSGISHELRTPLTQIRLFAELLEEPRLRSDENRIRWARIIDQEARRLAYMVENVLSFARAEEHALRVTPVDTDVGAVLDEVVQAFAPLAEGRRCSIHTEVPHGITVRADPAALRHVLLNFLDNAVKYGPEGQTIRVRVEPTAAVTRIAVEDQGPGVPAAERDAIWQPYYRMARDSATGGSGIGLAIVHELVRLQGGRAVVEDGADGGARFVVELINQAT
jgi:two-component system phosphate regulon sensor histidine kinase PhoR